MQMIISLGQELVMGKSLGALIVLIGTRPGMCCNTPAKGTMSTGYRFSAGSGSGTYGID